MEWVLQPFVESSQSLSTGLFSLQISRLQNSPQFQAVYKFGERFDGRYITIFIHPNYSDEHRIGITASRKVSTRAVDRNRLRRVIRETFRLSTASLVSTKSQYDWVINAKRALLKENLATVLRDLDGIILRVKKLEELGQCSE